MLLTRLNKAILYRYLFYKHFYRFIFLHKPLCSKYKDNTFVLFNLYVCRSCLLFYTGFLLALITGLSFIKNIYFDFYFKIALSGLIFILIVSYPKIYSIFNRKIKDMIRLLNGCYLALVLVFCFKISTTAGVFSFLAFIMFKKIYNKERDGSRICRGCQKLENGNCDGYIKQKQALLNIDEEYFKIMENYRK